MLPVVGKFAKKKTLIVINKAVFYQYFGISRIFRNMLFLIGKLKNLSIAL